MTEQLGLFTNEPVGPDVGPSGAGRFAAFRKATRYRKAEGHRNCGTCEHGYMKDYHTRRYRKCRKAGDSNCDASDVSKFCVCNLWMETAK